MNIPWPEKGMGDAEYIYAFQKVVMPIAMEFAPELVISMLNRLPMSPALMSRHMKFLQVLMRRKEMSLGNATFPPQDMPI